MSICALVQSNYSLQLIQHNSPSRSPSFAIVVRLAEQVDVASQFFRRVLHLVLQLQVLSTFLVDNGDPCLLEPSP